MYIYPNTDLRILRNIHLHNDYEHTYYFASIGDQNNFFGQSLNIKYTLTNQQYQRKERGWIQVNLNQNDLWDCTYLMYRNTSYKQKWFYAFILEVQYVNDSVSRIRFEIDVMQTWMRDYELDKCFVVREHTDSDELFEHLIDENLDLGTDLSVQLFRTYDLRPDRVVVVYSATVNRSEDPPVQYPAVPTMINNYYSGVGFIVFDASDGSTGGGREQLGDFLYDYLTTGYEDDILSIYQIPHFISHATLDPYDTDTFSITPNFLNIDGYEPKNKKLFNYPYNFLKLSNNKGDDVIYKHEMWSSRSDIGHFELKGVGVGIPAVMCYPLNYRDIAKDYENGLMYKGFNQCAWVGDAYQVWLAQNRQNLVLQGNMGGVELLVGAGLEIGGALAMAGSLPTASLPASIPMEIGAGSSVYPGSGNISTSTPIGGGSTSLGGSLMRQGLNDLANSILTQIQAKNKLTATPRPAHGHVDNDIFNMQLDRCGYTCYQMTIKRQFARIIDEYFSRFGYACHRIKVPNRHVRQKWTYTKTIGCAIAGNIPCDDAEKIQSIYNNGITFWDKDYAIGAYGDFTNPCLTPTT